MAEEIISQTPVDLSDWWQPIKCGADWQWTYKVDGNTTGWAMEVKIAKLDGTILKTLTVGSGIVNTPGASTSSMSITYSHIDTALLTVTEVKVQVKVTDLSGIVDYQLEGVVPVKFFI